MTGMQDGLTKETCKRSLQAIRLTERFAVYHQLTRSPFFVSVDIGNDCFYYRCVTGWKLNGSRTLQHMFLVPI